MEKVKLLIADQNKHFTEMLRGYIQSFPDIELIGVTQDGHEAMRIIRAQQPHAVLFDLVLPGIDGITLLRHISSLQTPPAMICCTRFFSDVALEALRTYGAAYVMFKPVDMQSIHPVILTCAQLHIKMRKLIKSTTSTKPDDARSAARIRNYIVSLGVPSKLIGCSYLTEAVRLAQEDFSLTRNLSKGLYLEISRTMNTSPTRIERCMRNAISAAYQSGGLDGKMLSCPSNKEFINYLLRTIEL